MFALEYCDRGMHMHSSPRLVFVVWMNVHPHTYRGIVSQGIQYLGETDCPQRIRLLRLGEKAYSVQVLFTEGGPVL